MLELSRTELELKLVSTVTYLLTSKSGMEARLYASVNETVPLLQDKDVRETILKLLSSAVRVSSGNYRLDSLF